MPRLSVPDRHKPALSKLLKLSDLGFNRLVEGLSAPFGELSEVPSRAQVDSLQSNEIEQIIDVLISLYLVLASREISVDQFSEDLAQAMRPTWKNEASEDEISRFRARINTALSIEPFAIQAKLRELLSDDERNFCDVKIVSDLRPVFGLRVEDGPEWLLGTCFRSAFIQPGKSTKASISGSTLKISLRLNSILSGLKPKLKALKLNSARPVCVI